MDRKFAHLRNISIEGGFSLWQKAFITFLMVGLGVQLYFNRIQTLAVVVSILIMMFFVITAYKFVVSFLNGRGVAKLPERLEELRALLVGKSLPMYAVIVPMYKEWRVLPQSVEHLAKLKYPEHSLRVFYLLEEDDKRTLALARDLESSSAWPENFEIVVIPSSVEGPRGKPRAMDWVAKRILIPGGFEKFVIYDAEDLPETDQVLKAAAAWSICSADIACLQAELRWYNRYQNWFTRMLAISYAGGFRILMQGLCASNGVVPLGGTSNHFDIGVLEKIGRFWDIWNVTEDADLGVVIRRAGYRVQMLPSVTWEQATTRFWVQVKQSSRWIKGYTATLVAHTRNPFLFVRDLGFWGTLSFLVIFGGTHLSVLTGPVFWVMTGLYLCTGLNVVIEQITPPLAFYTGTLCLLANFFFAWLHMFGCLKTEQYKLAPLTVLLPIYWVTVLFAAGLKATWEILVGRFYYWDKTEHISHTEEAVANVARASALSSVAAKP